jgi:1-acyl-sn-glycerol-3-phosphate acyltransferase
MSRLADRLTEALGDRPGDRLRNRLPRLGRPKASFPWTPPTWPGALPMPAPESRTGLDYQTDWSRRYPVRVARAVVFEGLTRTLVGAVVPPVVEGQDRLGDLKGPVIFAANHSSHLDTPLILSVLPRRFRHHSVVAGAADYFFDTRLKGALSAFSLGAIPFERHRVSRRSLELAAELLEEGWSVLIYPEGGRSPDGWGQAFSAGAAYLSIRTGTPMVPIHVSGTSRALPKGATRFRPGPTSVTFGHPIRAGRGEDARKMAVRLEAEVAALADEFRSDWWQARRRAAAGLSPALGGPAVSPWRREWARPRPQRRAARRPGAGTAWSRR